MTTPAQHAMQWHLPIAIVILLLPAIGWGYGADAHRIVGYIANEQLCDGGRAAINTLLGGDSLAEAGLWADKIRGYDEWDYAKPWHYINIPDGQTLQNVQRRKEGDVLWAIHEMNRRLDDASLSDKEHAEALKFLIHFVADIHQPLHVGRFADRGGNRIKVTYFRGPGRSPGKTNLHAYWDSEALKLTTDDPAGYAQQLMGDAEELAAQPPGAPEGWVYDALELRPDVYDFHELNEGAGGYLDSSYLTNTQHLLRLQLMRAGVRLGAVLNARYCVPAEAPARQAP